MARLTHAGAQWWVLLVAGTVGFLNELRTSKDPAVLTVCVGLMTTPVAFGGKKEPAP
jgi:hypothetical protein